jgi:Domain of unknown function (DUF3797)
MNAVKAFKLSKQYANCPNCGNNQLGNGQGSLIITEDTFVRNCKCGCRIEIKESDVNDDEEE